MCTSTEALAKRKQRRSSTRRVNAHGRSLNGKPALHSPRATTLPRPPHPKPYVRDDRDTPLVKG
jgi:hypothetical protein